MAVFCVADNKRSAIRARKRVIGTRFSVRSPSPIGKARTGAATGALPALALAPALAGAAAVDAAAALPAPAPPLT